MRDIVGGGGEATDKAMGEQKFPLLPKLRKYNSPRTRGTVANDKVAWKFPEKPHVKSHLFPPVKPTRKDQSNCYEAR